MCEICMIQLHRRDRQSFPVAGALLVGVFGWLLCKRWRCRLAEIPTVLSRHWLSKTPVSNLLFPTTTLLQCVIACTPNAQPIQIDPGDIEHRLSELSTIP